MSDKMRWRHGDINHVFADVDADAVIEIGDMVWQDIDDAKPAATAVLADDPDEEPDTLKAFVKKFLGVAMHRSKAGDTAPIRVATSGVFEFDCRGGPFELGDMVGADENVDGSALMNQQVTPVALPSHAIGRVQKREPLPPTSVLVKICSTIMDGGVAGTTAVK